MAKLHQKKDLRPIVPQNFGLIVIGKTHSDELNTGAVSDFGEQMVEIDIQERGAASVTGFPVRGSLV